MAYEEKAGATFKVAPQLEENQVNIAELMNEYEELEARLQELTERKRWIRDMIFGELVTQGIDEMPVITTSGTKFVLRVQKVRREKVDVRLLKADLGDRAERYITVTESEFLSIRPARKTKPELEDK